MLEEWLEPDNDEENETEVDEESEIEAQRLEYAEEISEMSTDSETDSSQDAFSELNLEEVAYEDAADEMEENNLIEEEKEEPERQVLKREMRAAALARMEDAATTEEDFQNVVDMWNRLDANRERRERYHEVLRSGDGLEIDYGAEDGDFMNHIFERQMCKGEFIEIIYSCPYQIHELVTAEYITSVLKSLKFEQKELLYQHYIQRYSTRKIGKLRGQSDRNIRKVRKTTLKRVRKKLLATLHDEGYKQPLTFREKQFLQRDGQEAMK